MSEPAARVQGRQAADPPDAPRSWPPFRWLGRRAGLLPQVRPGRPKLDRRQADGHRRASRQRGPQLDLADIKWELGRFGKLHVRCGKGARGSGPRERMVPLVNHADQTLRWFIQDVWGQFDDDHTRHGAPLLPSEHKNADGSCAPGRLRRVARRAGRRGRRPLPAWAGRLTPHVLRHSCASQLYLSGMDLLAIQELLGHAWIATTMRYVHVHRTRIEEAWIAGQQRAATRLEGLLR